MIRKATLEDWENIAEFVSRDFARNYFVAIGMLKGHSTFQSIYIDEVDQIRSVLFHRASNNLQFVTYGSFDVEGMIELMSTLSFNQLIAPNSYCLPFDEHLELVKRGALISELSCDNFVPLDTHYNARKMVPNDVEDVETLYKSVFPGHPRAAFMKEKLLSHRGIGYCYEEDRLMTVAQSEFGYVIVGVATEQKYQGKGYATSCLIPLIKELLQHHEKLYLQVDNPSANKLYEKMGFKPVDQVMHYTKR